MKKRKGATRDSPRDEINHVEEAIAAAVEIAASAKMVFRSPRLRARLAEALAITDDEGADGEEEA